MQRSTILNGGDAGCLLDLDARIERAVLLRKGTMHEGKGVENIRNAMKPGYGAFLAPCRGGALKLQDGQLEATARAGRVKLRCRPMTTTCGNTGPFKRFLASRQDSMLVTPQGLRPIGRGTRKVYATETRQPNGINHERVA